LLLYVSRSFSGGGYVLGEFRVLFVLLFFVTGAPMLLIYLLKSALAGSQWFIDNIHLAFAILIGSTVWVTLISLVALASSAWLRWRPAAAGTFFSPPFFPPPAF